VEANSVAVNNRPAIPDGALAAPTAARTFVATLRQHGVDRLFCLPGESFLALLDVLRDTPEIDVVTCRHEGAAGFAALADAKLTGRAGLCVVSRGPGAANAMIAVHAAAEDATPLVLVVGQVPTASLGRAAFQEIGPSAFDGVAKGVWQLLDPARTGELVARAIRVAESGTPGPAVLLVPEDVLGQVDTGPGPVDRPREAAPAIAVRDLDLAADLLAEADRPLLVAGARLRGPAGRPALRAAARRHELPIVVSNKQQDLIDNRDRYYAGHLYNNTPAGQRETFGRADLVLAVGTRLDAVTTGGYRFPGDRPLVHVYPDPGRLALTGRPALSVAADPAGFLAALAERPPGVPPERLSRRRAWIGELAEIEAANARWRPQHAADGVAFGAVVAALGELTGGDLLVAVDAGTFTSWVFRHLRFGGAGRLLGAGASPMGFGVPAAIAAALRRAPDDGGPPVVAVAGDGGFLMTSAELSVAAARRLPLVVIVADNGSLGTIRMCQERAYPGRPFATDLSNPDFARLAEAYGVPGWNVTTEAEVRPALAAAFAERGPAVVAVRTSLELVTAYRRLR